MSIELTMRAEIDAENDSAELFVRFQERKFSGESSAWIQVARLRQFASQLAKYPLDDNSLPTLLGGYWDSTGNCIDQEHVHISVRPSGNLGTLSLFVQLTMPEDDTFTKISKRSASIRVAINYEKIGEVAKGVLSMADGAQEEFSVSFAEE